MALRKATDLNEWTAAHRMYEWHRNGMSLAKLSAHFNIPPAKIIQIIDKERDRVEGRPAL